jgi:glycerol-3-phosphate acyltransferase PlsX
MRIAIDAMGGDFAPATIVEGAVAAARQLGVGLLLAGPSDEVAREIARHATGGLDIEILEAEGAVAMSEPPTAVLRHRRGASVRVAVEAVARGQASAVFSAGHTGATVLAAQKAWGLLPGIERPALAATLPTRRGLAVLLDSGVNLECQPRHFVDFARLGAAFSQVVLGVPNPRVGLLSIGGESMKGNELTRDAHERLAASALNFVGNVEARDVYTGAADVIVCDGFTGNIALKISEGLVDAVEDFLREQLARSVLTRLGAALARPAFRKYRSRLDHAEYGAAPLLGVAGLCLVGHGCASARAARNGIAMAARLADSRAAERIAASIDGSPS